ncbi:MAG TPA: phage tail length tape measure family protein [Paracoccus sp. (in: a-proteobacteria)]|uniref:phage tail length tape measure family protein n=1 Tax=Paracoccus sp. TaxID=267 RepID=UPI002D040398|nr:phage tail length tape measure family protein [Paracoccus sp. (in: a-proteobacteria)]HWL56968.1 phage tail length tape measure family protein [Paracoccus sp. (in: a-proteobacteria)]
MAMTGSTQYEVRVDATGTQSLTALIKSLNDATRAEAMMQKALTAETREARLAEKQRQSLARATDQLAKSTATAANQNARLSSLGATFSKHGAALQNFGRQAQDVAVQVSMGTSAFKALGQQAPQLLDSFGPLGALLGLVAAVALPLAGNFLEAEEATVNLTEATDALAASVEATRSAFQQASQPLDQWGTYTVAAAQGLRELSKAMLTLSQANVAVQQASTLSAIESQTKAIDAQALAWTRLEQQREDLLNFDPSGGSNLEAVNAQIAEIREGLTGTLAQSQYVGQAFARLGHALTEGRPAEEISGIVTGLLEWDRTAKVLTQEQRNILTEALRFSEQQTRSLDLQQQITDAAGGTTRALAGTTAQAAQLTAALTAAAGAITGIMRATSSLNLSTMALDIETAAILRGADAWEARGEAAKAAKREELRPALESSDAVIRKEAIAELNEHNAAIDRHTEAQRRNAKTQADAAKAASATAKAMGGAGKATTEATNAITKATDALNRALAEYMTPVEQAQADLAELNKLVADLNAQGVKLNPQQTELYARAVAQLNQGLRDTKTLSEQVEDTLGDGFTSLFTDLISGTKSAGEAWSDMLNQMLQELAIFLAQKQFQEFASLLVGSFTGTPSTASAANVNAAPMMRLAAPSVPSVASRGLGGSPYAVVTPGYVPSATAQAESGFKVQINNYSATDVTAEERTDSQGSRFLDVTIRDRVRALVSTGALDKEFQRSFGMRRRPG